MGSGGDAVINAVFEEIYRILERCIKAMLALPMTELKNGID
jgi:hypothetical protein